MFSRLEDRIFRQYSLYDVLRSEEKKMLDEIDQVDDNRLLNTSPDDLSGYFEQKYRIQVPHLNENEISVSQPRDEKIEIGRRDSYRAFDEEGPFSVTGTTFQFFIPFEGDRELFKYQPSNSADPPRATINEGEIVITYTRTEHDAAGLKRDIERDISSIRDNLEWIARDSTPFNGSLREKAKQRIEMRREKILKDKGLVSSLGFPLKQRLGAPQTYVAPNVKKKPPIFRPTAVTAPFVPEPALDMQEYEHILSVISNMVVVMERSPRAFHTMGEEDFRQHFLVQLNGHYEGQATGETFNYEGKTDILIRVNGRNIFIAECKLWRGEKYLRDAVDQLSSYVSWRDTKTALLIFNRKKDFSSVVGKIPEVITGHPNFKRKLDYKSETGFRYVLQHCDDASRELILTVLAFDVPK